MKFNSPIQFCINHWKVASALAESEGHSITLEEPQVTHSEGSILLWCLVHLYLQKSGISNPSRKSGRCLLSFPEPLVFGVMGRNPSLYRVFRCWKLMQKCKLPSFFLTSTMALHHALWLGLIAPVSNISLRWFLTSSTIGGGIHLKCSLNRVLSVTFIECSVVWVHPSSTGI